MMYKNILQEVSNHGATLLAVSKTKSASLIQSFYDEGQRDFGENKVQELVEKHQLLPSDIRWHMIGHLQSNKVKFIVPFVHLIHGVDSFKLVSKINNEAKKINRKVDILIQISISDEDTKFGWPFAAFLKRLEEISSFKHINIRGFMGMATNTSNNEAIDFEFKTINDYFKLTQKRINKSDFNQLSIGMSSDYSIALKNGATIVRIGSLIFGQRT